jgi:phenylpyruvate C(3)-methyltransferase
MNKTSTAQEIPVQPHDWEGSAVVPIGADSAFNGYVAAHLIFALDRLALLDPLESGDVDVPEFAARTGTDPRMLHELLRVAECCGYVDVRDGRATREGGGPPAWLLHLGGRRVRGTARQHGRYRRRQAPVQP